MATSKNTSADGTTKQPTAAEMRKWYEENKKSIENFAASQDSIRNLRDVNQRANRSIQAINKESLKSYISNIGNNEKNLRTVARYLYYRSNIFFRLVQWYSGMWDLNCRKVVPDYDLLKAPNQKKFLKSFNDTLDMLENYNIQNNMVEVLQNVYVEDVYYGLRFTDDTGTFFYRLEPDECIIDSRYMTSDFGFALDMSQWRSAARQQVIEYIGSPLKEMYVEYERTREKYVHCPDEYAVCFKFRTDIFDTAIPPLLPIFLSLASLEDLVDIQADADALDIYKLIYLPLKTHSASKDVDDFEISPDLSHQYFKRLIDAGLIPDNVAAAIIPGDELKYIDFSRTVDSDVTSVEKSQNQILATAGGGAVINANQITSTAAFNAWLLAETQFALSTLIGQITGAVNRWLSYDVSAPAKVEFFEVSVYTKKEVQDQLLESCKYSFSNRLAYNTFLGISEKQTMAMEYLEAQVLNLPGMQIHPLVSSFTQSGTDGEVGEGAPTKDAGELSESGDRARNS